MRRLLLLRPGRRRRSEANLDRWRGQFNSDAKETRESFAVGEEIDVTLQDLSGRYVAATRPGAAERNDESGWRMLAAIVEGPGGPLFIKFVGPEKTVSAQAKAFRAWIKSFEVNN